MRGAALLGLAGALASLLTGRQGPLSGMEKEVVLGRCLMDMPVSSGTARGFLSKARGLKQRGYVSRLGFWRDCADDHRAVCCNSATLSLQTPSQPP